ncbi:hypothetical protein X566_12045 [Afipia sp. P52-10]|nr:hypothetical protein X566_12045 [Afipia sp. P52-10]
MGAGNLQDRPPQHPSGQQYPDHVYERNRRRRRELLQCASAWDGGRWPRQPGAARGPLLRPLRQARRRMARVRARGRL